jgi:hypothetical protein
LDLQQQRIERAVGEELKATPTVITKTGIFDNIDKLYGSTTGGTATASTATPPPAPGGDLGGGDLGGGDLGAPPPAPAGEETVPPPAEGGEVTPESRMDNLNILVENNLIEGKLFLDLGQGQDSLGEISKELDKLLDS